MTDRKDWLALLLMIGLVLAVFSRALTGGVFYFGDIYQLHYPLRSAYASELAQGRLPLWTPQVFAGYPLLAEGQVGALYPPNLILHLLLPVPIALNLFILGHFLWAAIGAYVFARRLRVHRTGALCSALVYGLGGFLIAHLNHVNIVACAAWLPWLLLLTDRLLVGGPSARPAREAALLSLALGMELLAGHPQIALLSLLAVLAYGLYLAWAVRQQRQVVILFVGAMALGLALAAAQLLPSYELTQQSVRAEGLEPEFFTSFSMHPLYLASLLSPFALGNPYPTTSVELVGYVGWLPLILALVAPFLAHSRPDVPLRAVKPARFFAALALVALLLSLGRYNPVYMALLRLPVFSLFRVPGRYLYLFAISAAVMAGLGLDALLGRARKYLDATESTRPWWVIALVGAVGVLAAARLPAVDTWVAAWKWLPIALGAVSLLWLIWTWLSKGSSPALLAALALAIIAVDLVAFNAVYNLTYNQTMPLSEFSAEPQSLSFLRPQTGVYRVYTNEEIVPVLPVMRESFYPNLALIHGLSTGNGLFPLVPQRYGQYLEQMNARMLNLLGVKFYLIPQVLPVDEASESYDVSDRFALNPVGTVTPVRLMMVTGFEVESYVSHSVDWSNGKPVALITIIPFDEDEVMDFGLIIGSHTAEWAYDRSDVRETVRHSQAAVARTFPARSGFPPENHRGYVYRAVFRVPYPVLTQGVRIEPRVPAAYIHIERLALIDTQGNRHLLAHFEGLGDHTLAYRSEDVAIYQNNDVMPRVFVAYRARAVPDDAEALAILQSKEFDPRQEVLLATEQVAEGQPPGTADPLVELSTYDSQYVAVQVDTPSDGYLVLSDAWYPGWQARVDGQPAPILRADLIFRAVPITAGQHTVEFTYAPASFRTGLVVSCAALLVVTGLWLQGRRRR